MAVLLLVLLDGRLAMHDDDDAASFVMDTVTSILLAIAVAALLLWAVNVFTCLP